MSLTDFILKRHEKSLPRSKRKFNLYRLAVANKDVGAAEEICMSFLKYIFTTKEVAIPYHTSEAFIAAIVTSYARPFIQNDSDLQLPRKWREFNNPQFQDIHERMLKLRSEIYAHSDASIHPMTIVPAGYLSPRLGRKVPRTSMELGSITVPPESVRDFYAVARNLRERLEKTVFDEIEELYGGMDLPACPFPLRLRKNMRADGTFEPDEGL